MPVRIVMPRLGDFMTEGMIAKLFKSPGEQVDRGQVIAEIETEKLNYDLEATDSGIFHPIVSEGDLVPVDELIGYLLAADEEIPDEGQEKVDNQVTGRVLSAPPEHSKSRATSDIIPSTPGARKLAIALDVDINQVTATGPRGRVVESDVRSFADKQQGTQEEYQETPSGIPDPIEVVALKGMRKAIAGHMKNSLSNSAQLSFNIELDIGKIQKLKKQATETSGRTISITHVLIKACAEALQRVPKLNSMLVNDKILYFKDINIGVAVALSDGLIVPVVKNVEEKDMFNLCEATDELVNKARKGELAPDDLKGGTFTISVLGMVDGFTPILNAGQSGILGVGRSIDKPVVKKGEIVICEMMTFSLTVDHQVIDGAIAANFLRRFRQIIESPGILFK